jgi:hypothetical protein
VAGLSAVTARLAIGAGGWGDAASPASCTDTSVFIERHPVEVASKRSGDDAVKNYSEMSASSSRDREEPEWQGPGRGEKLNGKIKWFVLYRGSTEKDKKTM